MISSELATLGRVGEALLTAIQVERLSPSYLFEGSDAAAATRLARAFAAAVLSARQTEDERARTEMQVEAGTHPDLHVQGRDKATVISVDALTALLHQAHGTPTTGDHQVFLLDPAEAMEPEGIARYLKALEEPPRGTLFVLVSTRPERLPQTVLSRVRRVRIPPPTPEVVATALERDGVAPDEAKALARWGGGSLSRAQRLSSTGTHRLARDIFEAAVDEVPRVAGTVDATLAALTREATALAEQDPDEGVDRKREHLRRLLADLVFVLAVEARDRAAERAGAWFDTVTPSGALRLFESLGLLSASVDQNVTPAAVLLETVRVIRDAA